MRKANRFHLMALTIRSASIWQKMALDYQKMWLASSEVILRRSLQMALGAMTPAEAARMVMEKPTAYVEAAEKAVIASASRKKPAAVAKSALRPIARRASANARRLRRKSHSS